MKTKKDRNLDVGDKTDADSHALVGLGFFSVMIVPVRRFISFQWAGCCLLCLFPFFVQAATLDITTDFSADISQPSKNAFTNTTPLSGFCVTRPESCKAGEFSIVIPGLTANKYFDYLSADMERNHTSISIDGTPRTLVLTDASTGNKITVTFRISFFGMTHHRVVPASGDLFSAMSDTGLIPSGGCSGRVGYGTEREDPGYAGYVFGWGIPEYKVTCYRKLNNTGFQGEVEIKDFSLGYTLTTPDPLNVYAGTYEGELIYSEGEGGDIDFNAENTSDSEVRIRIKATVKHAFNIKFAPGSENVKLGAQGGWEPWINGGRVPQSLNKEVPFSLSSSTSFTVSMRCEHDAGNQKCGLQNTQTNETVPLDVALTLPGFKSQGADVNNMLLTSAAKGYEIDAPGTFITDRRSHVDFRVLQPAVETMVKSPNSTWKGTVTLLFDSQTE